MSQMRTFMRSQYIGLFLFAVTALSGCGGTKLPDQNTTPPTSTVNSHQMGGSIQVSLSSLTRTVSTLAGSTQGAVDGTGTVAKFDQSYGLTTDGTNLYIVDYLGHTIRKVEIATGVVSTLAGTAGSRGTIDGVGMAARFDIPHAITTDGVNLYVTDYSTIRRVVIATGAVTTIAGTPGTPGTTDGVGPVARFYSSFGITTDGVHLYVADSGNFTIRKVDIATGVVTTLAGTAGSPGSTDGTGATARFGLMSGITTDGTNLYVSDGENIIRRVVIATGAVTTLAGSAGIYGTTDGNGAAARFSLFGQGGITTDGTNLFVSDAGGNNTIRKIEIATGIVSTLIGTATVTGSANGVGAAASFGLPSGITTDGKSIFVMDTANYRIRKID